MIRISRDQLPDLSDALKLEWLETNGLGGYAMGTVAGANARRYHGLLCAAARPPVDRRMILSRLEDRVRIDGDEHHLSCNVYGDVVHPDGFERLREFRLDPWPTWTYAAGPATIEKAVLMLHGRSAVVIRYTCLDAPQPIALRARPLFAWRDHHHTRRADVEFSLRIEETPRGVEVTGPDGLALIVDIGDGAFWPSTEWYYGFTYPQEAARGLDDTEDLYGPGEIEWTLRAGESVALVAAFEELPGLDVDDLLTGERTRRMALVEGAGEDDIARTLFLAADQFIVARPDQGPRARSIVAGYPWFTDWGRDTMIALPGLLLATGRHAEALEVLRAYAAVMDDGLIPNRFPDEGAEADYNTVDATLWFFVAAKRYHEATDDIAAFESGLFEAMQTALAAHVEGTRFGIRMEQDGLITAGDPSTQLTWMDAKVGDWVVTPRHGKAVEINALWYSAVRTLEFLAAKLGRDPAPYAQLADRIKGSFIRAFWSDDLGYLYDCVRGDERDASLRPNQVIALALPYSPLSEARRQSILHAVTEKLVTPYGLRTLSPDDERYRGRYEGDPWSRDGAYHQGTVWPWLLGPYVSAFLALSDSPQEARRQVRELIQPLVDHLGQAGLGSISEVFDGDAPHTPGGCPAQAWSVAELLRVWVESDL